MRSDLAAEVADAVFEELGRAAFYRSPYADTPVPCIVRDLGGDELAAINDVRVRRDARMLKVRVSQVAEPVESSVFTVETAPGGLMSGAVEYLRVAAVPRREDSERLTWLCEVGPATGPLP